MRTVSQCATSAECKTYNEGYRNGFKDGRVDGAMIAARAYMNAEKPTPIIVHGEKSLMDEHMMAAQIAALKSEIETLKPLAEKGLRLEKVLKELETEIEDCLKELDDGYDEGVSARKWALRHCADMLKGV